MINAKKIEKAFKIVFALCLFYLAAAIAFFEPDRGVLSIFVMVSILPLGLFIYPKMSYAFLNLTHCMLLTLGIVVPLMEVLPIAKVHYVIIPLIAYNLIHASIVKWDYNKKNGLLRTMNYNIYIIAIVNLLHYFLILSLSLFFNINL